MRAIGNDRPTGKCLVHHKDSARMLDGTESVRDQDGGPPLAEFCQCLLNASFTFTVERTGRFIQDQNGRILQKARAMAMRCRCPPDRPSPRCPNRV